MIPVPELHTLGLGPKFAKWRRQQKFAVQQIVNADRRFVVQVQPTGSGKTLCYVAAASLLPGRTLILTSFKGLQDQLHRDHGLFVLMGRSAYQCKKKPGSSCEDGPCRVGAFCAYKSDSGTGIGCPYLNAIADSRLHKIVVANYSFWLSNARQRSLLGKFDFLVCDEAHIIPNYILDFMGVTVRRKQVEGLLAWPSTGLEFSQYHTWLRRLESLVSSRVRDIKKLGVAAAKNSALVKFHHKLSKVEYITYDNWVIECTSIEIKAGMIWPTDVVQRVLFTDVPKVLLTSATVDKPTCVRMGLNNDNMLYQEYPSDFPSARRPIYSVPCVRVDFRWTPGDQRKWMQTIDRFIGARVGLRGIIHAVSYDRCKYILANSEYRDLMMSHTSANTRAAVELFKKSPDKCILVSPSIVAGWDFPYDECRWQVVCKVPFPDLRSPIDKARKAKDPECGNLLAIQNLEQICGRGMRFADDWCETVIVDDHFRWFYNKTKQWSHKWFQDAVVLASGLPEPLQLTG